MAARLAGDRRSQHKQGAALAAQEAQAVRRQRALAVQQQKRNSAVDAIRHAGSASDGSLAASAGSEAIAPALDLLSLGQSKPTSLSRAPLRQTEISAASSSSSKNDRHPSSTAPYAERLMRAELPDPLPRIDELRRDWLLLGPLPRGKRCLAVVNRPVRPGAAPTMTLYSRRSGKPMAIYPAAAAASAELEADMEGEPAGEEEGDAEMDAERTAAAGAGSTGKQKNGRRIRFPAPQGLPHGTQLDCILPSHHREMPSTSKGQRFRDAGADADDEEPGVLYVLDILHWGGGGSSGSGASSSAIRFEECDAEFRMYWRDARLAELPSCTVLPRGAHLSARHTLSHAAADPDDGEGSAAATARRVQSAPYPFVLVPVTCCGAPLSAHSCFPAPMQTERDGAQESDAEDRELAHALHRPRVTRQIRVSVRVQQGNNDSSIHAGDPTREMMELDGSALPCNKDGAASKSRMEIQTVLIGSSGDPAAKTVTDDGMLLYHREACYHAGLTPLALWLPPL